MELHSWSGIETEQLNPKAARQVIHAKKLTIARLFLKKGAIVKDHSHHNEQVTVLEEGRLLFVIDGEEIEVEAGQVMEIPPNAVHSVVALEDSVALDLFSPPREDWMRGEDAYLRG